MGPSALPALGSPTGAGAFLALVALASSGALACARGNDVDGIGGGSAGGSTAALGGELDPTGGGGAHAGGSAPGAGGAGGQGGAPSGGGGAGGSSATNMPPPGTIFFSEYVEGSANNKAVEVVNRGPTPLSLGDCVVNRYQNGSTTAASPVLALDDVMLAAGDVFVLCNDAFGQSALCDQLSPDLQHSGNDAVELVCGGDTKDVIGRIGEDMVWGSTPETTQDATLRRACTVSIGDENGGDAFDPADEWEGFAADTFGDLGSYDCP